MKFKSLLLSTLLVLWCIFNSPGLFAQDMVNVYRVYNPVNSEHLYTADHNEVVALVGRGWNDEGIGWICLTEGEPVYRLYNPGLDDHLYTTSVDEMNILCSNFGWQKDFNGNPLFYSNGTIPVHRLYNSGLGHHHLSIDNNECQTLCQHHNWNTEGVSFYAYGGGNPTPTTSVGNYHPEPEQDYILDSSTMTFHNPDCAYLSSGSHYSGGHHNESSRHNYHGTHNSCIGQGYHPCPYCNP